MDVGGVISVLLLACTEEKKTIVCWGDSLTAPQCDNSIKSSFKHLLGMDYSYPSVLERLVGDNYKVINCGVGGETTLTIMARQGSAPMLLAHDVTIFGKGHEDIPQVVGTQDIPAFVSSWGDGRQIVTPLLQNPNSAQLNPVTIAGRSYELKAESQFWMEGSINHHIVNQNNTYIVPIEPSDTSYVLSEGTSVVSNAASTLRDKDVNVFFVGQNGGFTDVADLICQIKTMIAYGRAKQNIVISFHRPNKVIPSPKRMSEMEDSLQTAFGTQYINLRKHMIENGLREADIIGTREDYDSIAKGEVPPTLMVDGTHFTPEAYAIIAKLVRDKIYKKSK